MIWIWDWANDHIFLGISTKFLTSSWLDSLRAGGGGRGGGGDIGRVGINAPGCWLVPSIGSNSAPRIRSNVCWSGAGNPYIGRIHSGRQNSKTAHLGQNPGRVWPSPLKNAWNLEFSPKFLTISGQGKWRVIPRTILHIGHSRTRSLSVWIWEATANKTDPIWKRNFREFSYFRNKKSPIFLTKIRRSGDMTIHELNPFSISSGISVVVFSQEMVTPSGPNEEENASGSEPVIKISCSIFSLLKKG